MKPIKLLILLLLVTKAAFAQYAPNDCSLNKVDEKGRKQGLWMFSAVYNERELKTTEQGFFVDNNEVGIWRYYNEDGFLEKIRDYDGNGFYEKVYYANNVVKSEGRYVIAVDTTIYYVDNPITDQKERARLSPENVKTGEWKYYKENGKLDAVEKY